MMRFPSSLRFSTIFLGASLGACAMPSDTPTAPRPSATPPAITLQPQSQSVSPGAAATFTVNADGTAPLTYQWQKNGAEIGGATANTYTSPATAAGDNGSTFVVIVSNAAGQTVSSVATLTISPLTPRSYTTKFLFTENPLSEKGNWIRGSEPGTAVQTTPDLAFGTGSQSNDSGDAIAVLGGTWNLDQMAQGIVHTTNQNANLVQEIELLLRTSLSGGGITGYKFKFRVLAKGNSYVQIVRGDGSTGGFSILAETIGPGVSDGDLIQATAKGNELTALINGVQVLQANDNTITGGGPGIGFFNRGPAQSNADYGFENFYATELTPDNH